MSKWDAFIDGFYLVGVLMALGIFADFCHQWVKKLTGHHRWTKSTPTITTGGLITA